MSTARSSLTGPTKPGFPARWAWSPGPDRVHRNDIKVIGRQYRKVVKREPHRASQRFHEGRNLGLGQGAIPCQLSLDPPVRWLCERGVTRECPCGLGDWDLRRSNPLRLEGHL